jgi:hypothetical protein
MVWAMALGIGGAVLAATWNARRQTHGRGWRVRGRREPEAADRVMEASEDSFPASDPPSHTPTTGTRV